MPRGHRSVIRVDALFPFSAWAWGRTLTGDRGAKNADGARRRRLLLLPDRADYFFGVILVKAWKASAEALVICS